MIIAFLLSTTVFGQSLTSWRTKLSSPNKLNVLKTEGHDLSFNQKVYAYDNQFIELNGGMGVFYPDASIKQTVSSGFTFNKGINAHYFSIGFHTSLTAVAEQNVAHFYNHSPQIGYQYNNNKLSFKMHFQPVVSVSQNGTGLQPTTTIGFGCNI